MSAAPVTITRLVARDIRFPTSRHLDGSDAMNPDPDYSAAYVVLETDGSVEGHGMTFTIGRGNDLCVSAARALAPFVVGKTLAEITADMAGFWRTITGDSQLRWLGPDKGVMHLATAAVVNAVWDLWAKAAGKPLWRLVAEMGPAEIVGCVDFRYIDDVLTPDEAIALLEAQVPGRAARIAALEAEGYPSYTTSAGWLGYDDETLRRKCRDLQARGWQHFKMKVGRDLEDDRRRARILREEIGPERLLMIDANQVWSVHQAAAWVNALAPFRPYFIEEPTSPDDVLGHATIARAVHPVKVATGEMCHNRIVFKQLFQANAIGVAQPDACRLGGVNEFLAVLLLAAKHQIPVWPHAGGVGLCEYVQHLAMIDFVAVSGTRQGRLIEYADHLHEHFVDPVVMRQGHYMPPSAPGYSITMKPASLDAHQFPDGAAWRG